MGGAWEGLDGKVRRRECVCRVDRDGHPATVPLAPCLSTEMKQECVAEAVARGHRDDLRCMSVLLMQLPVLGRDVIE